MNTKLILLCAAALAVAPLAFAHAPAGTPKNYCEPASDWAVHDYGPVASGRLLYGNEDGNIGGDCDPGFSFTPGEPCVGFEDPQNPLTFFVGLCGSELNPPLADWDGHNEFAFGGAWLLSANGAGVPSADPSVGAGTRYCFGAEAHHPASGPFTVEDPLNSGPDALANTIFLVAADIQDLAGTGQGCGDFQTDQSWGCRTNCFVTFPPGLDGAYIVYVEGTAGHIRTDLPSSCEEQGPHDFFLVPGDSTFEPQRHVGCGQLTVTTDQPGLVVTFYPSGRTCLIDVPSTTCVWRRDRWFVLSNTGANGATGTWTQVP